LSIEAASDKTAVTAAEWIEGNRWSRPRCAGLV